MEPDGRLIPWTMSAILLLFTNARQKYVIVLLQSGARPVNSPGAVSVKGLLSHVVNGTRAVIQGRYDWVPLSKTICRHGVTVIT